MFNLLRLWISSDRIEVPVDEVAPQPLPGPSNEKTLTKRNLSETSPIGKGAKLRKQSVMIITRVKNFIRKVIAEDGVLQGRNVNRLVEKATGLSQSTIKRISKIEDPSVYQTPEKKSRKGSNPFNKIDDFTRDIVRRTVYECYRSGVSPTVESITRSLREKTSATDYEFSYGKSTVCRLLRSMGFSHKIVRRKPTRAESSDIVAWRYSYLEKIRDLCLQGYYDVYLDETWYDSHVCRMKNWTEFVIVHCGGSSGFIDGALGITHNKMADAPADYHGTMNSAIFEDWFENSVLKMLEEPSVIV
ncbi:hypothetical protein C0J52_23382 [Blattella germanica]|nr:hypothetical protein C0J52_23382 [Blattella germanica]